VTIAEQEGNSCAAWSFKVAREVEQIHANLFMKASAALEKDTAFEAVGYYVCGVCGNTVENEPPEKCPICAAPKTKFSKVELKYSWRC
jgi:rubrerythrin